MEWVDEHALLTWNRVHCSVAAGAPPVCVKFSAVLYDPNSRVDTTIFQKSANECDTSVRPVFPPAIDVMQRAEMRNDPAKPTSGGVSGYLTKSGVLGKRLLEDQNSLHYQMNGTLGSSFYSQALSFH